MNRALWQFPGGIHPPQHKYESTRSPIARAPLPRTLVLPLQQHIGAPSTVLVTVGERVLKGQRLAKADGYVSVSLHAPTSGRIVAIEPRPVPHPSGLSAACIIMESDGEEQWIDRQPLADYHNTDPSHLRNFIREAGIVGLGGAGFPAYIKMNPGSRKSIDTLIINGIECEPYITCDDMLMRERADEIIAGTAIIRHALQARTVVIAIEDNKPEAIAAVRQAAGQTDFDVVTCPTVYPQGSEKQLIQVITGKEVPKNGLPLHVGVVVQNVATAAAVFRAVERGEPLISRIVTVTGEGIGHPQNREVLFGTRIAELTEQCGGLHPQTDRVLMGGPMMGFALHTLDIPVIKTTNCILALKKPFKERAETVMPCIRCGACADACPVRLLPQQLYWYARARDWEKTQDYNLFDCIECGCCAYVCPSNLPLVHYYRFAKSEIWAKEREKEKSDLARQRFEFRQQRLEREKAERAKRHERKKQDLQRPHPKSPEDPKRAAIRAAIERVQQKKQPVTAAPPHNGSRTAGAELPPEPPTPQQPASRDSADD